MCKKIEQSLLKAFNIAAVHCKMKVVMAHSASPTVMYCFKCKAGSNLYFCYCQ